MDNSDGWEESEGWGTQTDDGATRLQIAFDPGQTMLTVQMEAGAPNHLIADGQVEEQTSIRLIGPAAALFWARLKERLTPPPPPAGEAPFTGLEGWPPEPTQE
jgi:hypothetical protein